MADVQSTAQNTSFFAQSLADADPQLASAISKEIHRQQTQIELIAEGTVADVTTAFSLFINCLSPIQSILQFGLCGGVLVMLNFGIVLVYTPALLVLHEAREPGVRAL